MSTSSVCDPARPAALSRVICRPHGVTIFGVAAAALGALSGVLLSSDGAPAKVAGTVGLLGTGLFLASSSPEASRWAKETKAGVQSRIAQRRQEKAERKAELIPVAVPLPIDMTVQPQFPSAATTASSFE
jgi:hypothetical protein